MEYKNEKRNYKCNSVRITELNLEYKSTFCAAIYYSTKRMFIISVFTNLDTSYLNEKKALFNRVKLHFLFVNFMHFLHFSVSIPTSFSQLLRSSLFKAIFSKISVFFHLFDKGLRHQMIAVEAKRLRPRATDMNVCHLLCCFWPLSLLCASRSGDNFLRAPPRHSAQK